MMEIVSVRSSIVQSDGRVRKEYFLSSPVTNEILAALSQGEHIETGRQYLSPTYLIIKSDGFEIRGILLSPIIVVISPPGMSTGIEDYLSGFLSTIPDSEKPDSPFHRIIQSIKSSPLISRFKNN